MDTKQSRRVLVVIQGAAYGGAHNQAARLGARLLQQGFGTRVLMTDEPGNAAERLRHEDVPIELMRLRRIRARKPVATLHYLVTLPLQVRRLRRCIRASGASIVQAHGITNLDVAVAADRERVALVWQILDTRAPAILRRLLSPIVVRLADAVLVTGTTTLRFYPKIAEVGERLHSYFPPVEARTAEQVAAARARARAILGASESDVLVGSLANLNPQKGHDHLLTAFALIDGRVDYPARLLIRGAVSAGHEQYRRALDAMVVGHGLPHDTLGTLPPDVPASDFIAALDVFCLSAVGRSEGTPTVIIEAMQAGLPVVVTAAGGVTDLVRDGVDGLVVDPSDDRALADAIGRLVGDPPLRRRMGAAARERATTNFAIERCVQAYLDAYSDAIAHRLKRGIKGRHRSNTAPARSE